MTSPGGEGIHGEGYDHWDRLGKASVPSPCGVQGRPAGIAQAALDLDLTGWRAPDGVGGQNGHLPLVFCSSKCRSAAHRCADPKGLMGRIMDTAYISAISALAGSVIGASPTASRLGSASVRRPGRAWSRTTSRGRRT